MTNQPTREETPLSENPFEICQSVRGVIEMLRILSWDNAFDTDRGYRQAEARIGELSPRTVDEAGRERAREVTYDWWLNTTGMSRANADQLVDRIIDALGWTAEPERDCENCGGRKCMSCCSREMHDDCADDCPMCCPAPVPPAPVVEHDPVNHPKHYRHPSGVDCITITEHMNFCVGNAMKYLWRADEKGNPVEDLQKARWYIDREIARRIGGDQ